MSGRAAGNAEVGLFRLLLLGFAALATAGTAAELAMERHWETFEQDIPWVGVGLTVAAIALVAVRPGRAAIVAARTLAVAVLFLSAFGVWGHARANYNAGPLDFRFTERWDGMSGPDRWWTAFSKGVGPAPTLAPGVLAQAALLTIAASLRHPAIAPPARD